MSVLMAHHRSPTTFPKSEPVTHPSSPLDQDPEAGSFASKRPFLVSAVVDHKLINKPFQL